MTNDPSGVDVPIHHRLGIQIVRVDDDEVEGRMPVSGNTQPFGALHGGAGLVLAESLASIGAQRSAPPGADVWGVELSASHHRAARSGWVTGRAVPLHRGRTLSTWQVRIHDEESRAVSTVRVTCLVRARDDG